MTILVTGSAGHLGEAVLRTLRAAGRPARGLDIVASPYTDHVGSIGDRDLLRRALTGVRAVIHAATLHKPHVTTHRAQEFIDVNVTGTLAVLEEAVAAGVGAVVFTSTTSAFGAALTPAPGEPAAWVTEDVVPIPRNIYGVTKVAAEGLCELFHRLHRLPVLVLRTSRFFPEADDDAVMRDRYALGNAQANELLYRRVDIEDVVDAHLRAVERAPHLGFGRYIVSATTPFTRDDADTLRRDAADLVRRRFPQCEALYAARGWKLLPQLDRVYVNRLARTALGWQPKYDFGHVLDCLHRGSDFRSALAREVGSKGYHPVHSGADPAPGG